MYIPSQYGRLVARQSGPPGADNNHEARSETSRRNNIFIIVSLSPDDAVIGLPSFSPTSLTSYLDSALRPSSSQ